MIGWEYCLAYSRPWAFISLPTSSAKAKLVLKSGLMRETKTEYPLKRSLKWLFFPSNSQSSRNLLGTESWWIDRKRSAGRLLAASTRLTRLRLALPSVSSNLVSVKPSAFNFSSIRFARRRLKTNSETLRALIAPSDSAVCPTSSTIRNFAGSQRVATGFRAAGFNWTGPSAASFTAWRFGETARFVATAGLDTLTCFAGLACLDDLLCFEPLKTSDSHPAWLASIGTSTIAAMATTMVRRRGQNREAILPRMQMSSRRFMPAPPEGHHNSGSRYRKGAVTSVQRHCRHFGIRP